MSTNRDTPAALLFTRCLLGTIFFFQGFGKLFTFGLTGIYESAFAGLEGFFPIWLLWGTLYFTTFLELFGGLALLLGWQRLWVYRLFGLLLVIVSIGHGVESPIWDVQHVIVRTLLLLVLWLSPNEMDKYSLDVWLEIRGKKNNP